MTPSLRLTFDLFHKHTNQIQARSPGSAGSGSSRGAASTLFWFFICDFYLKWWISHPGAEPEEILTHGPSLSWMLTEKCFLSTRSAADQLLTGHRPNHRPSPAGERTGPTGLSFRTTDRPNQTSFSHSLIRAGTRSRDSDGMFNRTQVLHNWNTWRFQVLLDGPVIW